jgi:DNA gyrase subunit B
MAKKDTPTGKPRIVIHNYLDEQKTQQKTEPKVQKKVQQKPLPKIQPKDNAPTISAKAFSAPKKNNEYTSENITVLEGLEPVRKRPGMYIGSTGEEGLHHLVWEIVDNAVDEAMAGYATRIDVTLQKDGGIKVIDNGRGIPVDVHSKTKKSALETVLTVLHAGGKFGGEASGYKVSGGLHGVGAAVVNALSTDLYAEVKRDGKIYTQSYKRGEPQGKVKESGKVDKNDPIKTGTTIIFYPDVSIFTTVDFKLKTILEHLRSQANLTKGLHFKITDENDNISYQYYFEGGVISYIRQINRKRKVKNEPIYINKVYEDILVEIAIQYTEDFDETVLAYANNEYNPEGGMHVTGFRTALTRSINNYAVKNNYVKESEKLTGEDMREGLTAIISVKLPNPQFEGQTKAKLGNPEVRTAVESVMTSALETHFEEHPQDATKIIEKVILASKARLAARAARESVIRKGILEGLTLPGKLADCSSNDPSVSEIYIVEGDSAGGTAKQGRDRKFQAILPLRGKILNVERARLDRMLGSEQIKNLVIAMGAGVGDQFDPEKLRYHRIIIMTDADVDGAHIRTLLLTLYYRYFPEVIRRGYLYIAQPPLFKVNVGKNSRYAFSEQERDDIIKILLAEKEDKKNAKAASAGKTGIGKGNAVKEVVAEVEEGESAESAETEELAMDDETKAKGYNVQRYKGLGEMNAEQLWETTMDPASRLMLQVRITDAEKASEIFETLMGDEVAPRKRFIQAHAKNVKNLDV